MRLLGILLIALMVALLPGVVSAQDATPVLPDIDVTRDAGTLIAAVLAILQGLIVSPLVTTIVGALKQVAWLRDVRSDVLALATSVVIYVLAAVAGYFGFQDEFRAGAEAIYVILPALLSFVATLFGAGGTYKLARTIEAPLLGYKRPFGRT